MSRRAMTLIEVLVAIALLSILAGSMFSFLYGVQSRRDRIVAWSDAERSADAVFEALEDALLASVAETGEGAGISGSATALTVYARRSGLKGGADEPLRQLDVSFRGGSITMVQDDSVRERLPGAFDAVRFRYFSGRVWETGFDTRRAGTLPVAIEVSVWFGDRPAGASGAPDRQRVMLIPDGPAASWSLSS